MTSQPFAVPALLLFVVAVPLVLGVVPRNRLYGVRTARSLSDDGVWYPANRVVSTWCIHLGGCVAPVVLGLVAALWYAKRF